MPIRIELKLPKPLSLLIGNNFGMYIYQQQVKNMINFQRINIIVIPDFIENISISFVQGFTKDIIEQIGLCNFYKYFTVEGNENVVRKFNRAVSF